MSTQVFNGQITANGSVDTGSGFQLFLSFDDIGGQYTGLDIAVGDCVYLDTAAFILETVSRYKVTSIVTADAASPVVTVAWDDPSSTAIDPVWAVGFPGFMSRATEFNRFNMTSENVPLKFLSNLDNENFRKVDTLVRGFTYAQNSASIHWVVPHNLGYHPSVSATNMTGDEIGVQVVHDSVNQLSIYLGYSLTGYAYCT